MPQDWFIADSDGLETIIKDKADPLDGEGEPGEFGTVCWGATPEDGARIIAARDLMLEALATVPLAGFKQFQLCYLDLGPARASQQLVQDVGKTDENRETIREIASGVYRKALAALMATEDDSRDYCQWCSEEIPDGVSCKREACPGVIAKALISGHT